jgi:hypothetical protein
VTSGRAPKYGTNVSFSLNAPGEIRFVVLVQRRGRAARLVKLRGSFTVRGHRGINRFHFTGRIAGHKLSPGRYELLGTPVTGRGSGQSVALFFRIIG